MRLQEKQPAAEHGDNQIDPAHRGDRDQRQGRHHGVPAIDHDLASHHHVLGHDGEHRHPGGFVLLLEAHRQRPVVRGGPEEDDQEQDQRRPRQGVGDGGPADEHRHTAGNTAPHDVLGGAALEQHRVEADIQHDRTQGQRGGQPVDQEPEPQRRSQDQHGAEAKCGRRRDHTGDQRTVLGPVHELVDVAVQITVERVGGSSRQGATDKGRHDQPQRRQPTLRQEHRRERRDQEQLDDARLGQRDIVAQGPGHLLARCPTPTRVTGHR